MRINLLLWECFINLMEILLFYLFLYTKLERKDGYKHPFSLQLFFLSGQFLLICILNQFDISSLIMICSFCLLDIVFAVLFYQDTIIMRIFWGGIYSVICLVAEYITILVPQSISNIEAPELLLGGVLRIPFTLLYITLIAIFVFIFYFMGNNCIEMTGLQKIFYMIISISGIMIGHYILVITLELEELIHSRYFTSNLTLVNLFFLILFLSLLLYIYQLGRSKELNSQLIQKQKLYELEELEYHNLIQATEALREMKHDMDIHLDVIQLLATDHKTDELIAYIEEYNRTLNQSHHLITTGNTAIDCILSSKIELAYKKGIAINYSVMSPDPFPLDAVSLSSLLGNLWNNALEACERLINATPDSRPSIHFYIKPFKHMVIIHIENTYDGQLKYTANRTLASLKNHSEHGIGVKRIHDITEQSNGIIQINTENQVFSVHIMIPVQASNISE